MKLKRLIALTLTAAAVAVPCSAATAQTTAQQIAAAQANAQQQSAAATTQMPQQTSAQVQQTAPQQTYQTQQAAQPARPAVEVQPARPAQPAPQPADVVTWVTSETAEAPCIVGTLAPNQVALGKVHIHDSTSTVQYYWTAPTKISGHGKWLTYTYGQTFGVRFHQGGYRYQDYGATEVSTIAPNGIATPAGIEVGMPDTILQQKYGMPSRLSTAKQENGYTTTYYYYGYGSELGHELSFDVREGKIIKIRLRSYYEFPQHFYR